MKQIVLGVTSVDDELFVLLRRKARFYQANKPIAVYSISDYQLGLLRHLKMPGYTPGDRCDMTSCVRHKCLYMSDYDHSCIHRYDLVNSATSKWSLPYTTIHGLSVTPSCNLLVTCHSDLIEFSADGQRVRKIALQSDNVGLEHSLQLTNDKYIVCHNMYRGLHRVCLVGDDGKVARSYGGQRGRDVGQLHCPTHLAVDKDSQFIFVADDGNHRVVLLSPTLEFVRFIIEGLPDPRRLYFHQATRRLFVGHFDDVTVIQL